MSPHQQSIATVPAEVNTLILGLAPSVSVANQMLNLSFAQSLAAYNAVYTQQQSWMVMQSSTTRYAVMLLSS